MLAIKAEIDRVASGELDREDNPLHQAPHTAAMLAAEWKHGCVTENTNAPPGTSTRESAANSWRISGMSMIAIVHTALSNRVAPSERIASALPASSTWYSIAASGAVRARARAMNSAL